MKYILILTIYFSCGKEENCIYWKVVADQKVKDAQVALAKGDTVLYQSLIRDAKQALLTPCTP